MRKFLITVFLFTTTTFAGEKLGDCKAIVDYVYDGDTIFVSKIECYKGELKTLERNVKTGIRLLGVDTPEMNGKKPCEQQQAIKAKNFISKRIEPRQQINITNAQDDKFGGRIDGTVSVNGKDLAKELINNGLGYKYDGGKKQMYRF